MGTFLTLSSVIGKTKNEVIASLTNYAHSVSGGLQSANNMDADTDNGCIIDEANANVSIVYPRFYSEGDDSAAFISKELNATVFAFHIHDGDFWMYVLYNNGQVVDQFNPIPDYWDSDISDEAIESWKGNAKIVAQYSKNIKINDINRYLVRWDLENDGAEKAYSSDEFGREDWQLTDFMNKLQLPYPFDDHGEPKGDTFKIWTKELQLKQRGNDTNSSNKKGEKPWWKFW
jgi:hypothetical protein